MKLKVLFFVIFNLVVLAPTCFAQIDVIVSTADGQRKLERQSTPKRVKTAKQLVELNPNIKYQQIIGFGGTYSEATAFNLKKLSEAKRNEVTQAFFNPQTGAGWNLMRTTINSCDASSEYYSYDEISGDTSLRHFSIQKDIDNYMIGGLQAALAINPKIKIFASPWTPPIWMKDTKVFNQGSLLPQFYDVWANYFSKYLRAYKQAGIPVWAVTPQNEPEAYQQRWDACGWQPAQMRNFIAQHLGPRLEAEHPDVKIIAWDHNKNHMLQWCDTLLQNLASAKHIDAVAHHWYDGGEGKFYEPVETFAKRYPQLPMIAAEQGVFGLYLNESQPAELYARDLIANLNAGTAGWVVWGMAFDHAGGPNHAANFNHSPIMIDVKQQILHYNPSYYCASE
jgi:glucosylceramidase